MSEAALGLAGVSVTLSGKRIVSEVALEVDYGEFVAVVGPNGSGKTTLLRAICGLITSEGTIALDGSPLADLTIGERARRLSYLPQGHVFHWPMTVEDVVGLGRLPRGRGADLSDSDRAAVTRALQDTGTTEFAARAVTTLSGGERARVALARVLSTETPLILADEPTASLDPRYQNAAIDILRRHTDAFGAVVAVLHDLGLAARSADRIVVLDGGRIVADGSPRAVLTPVRLAATFGIAAELIEVRGSLVLVPTDHDGGA